MAERIQRVYDAVLVILQNTEVFVLAAWGSLGVLALMAVGVFTLYKTVVWVRTKPSAAAILKEIALLLLVGAVALINVGLPLGLIALIPGAGQLVADLVNAVFGG